MIRKRLSNNALIGARLVLSVCVGILSSSVALSQSDTIQTTVPHLKDVYAHDFYIGCLLSYRHIGFSTDPIVPGQSPVITPNGGYLIQYHMNSMSPGNNMKPQYTVNITTSAAAYNAASTQVQKDSVNIHPTIQFNGDLIAQLNWAQRQGFTFRGHTLVWHAQTPKEFFRTGYSSTAMYVSKDTMAMRMDFYMEEVIRLIHQSWPGLLSAIDVVNEAIDDGTGKVRTTNNDWYATFHDSSYVMKAFQLARQYTVQYGETQIKLYYNDYSTDASSKANGIVALLTPIYQAGYLDGIGMQEHNSLTNPTAQAFIASYDKFFPICSEMAVTELDVKTNGVTNWPSASILAQQANQYGQLFKCFVERSYKSGRGKIISVSKDGLNDWSTFVTNQSTSLWDSLNQCKPSFFAVVDVGHNYNALDSLITYADSLHQGGYSASSWANLTAELTSAKAARDQNYSVSVSAGTALGLAVDSLQGSINALVVTSVSKELSAPKFFSLGQNYPNPFNPTTRINYSVPVNGFVSLKVYNMLGAEVATLYSGNRQAGDYSTTFNASGLASGVYCYRLQASTFSDTKKLILMK
jgi:GH35 family endo-1,4-beta-xylanase